MSLTSQLDGGALGAWFAGRFPGTERLAASITTAANRVDPVPPPPAEHHHTIDRAFTARAALLIDGSPPYSALQGLVTAGLASQDWAHRTAATFPSHRGLPPHHAKRAQDFRPTPTGWLDLKSPPTTSLITRHEPMLTEFFGRLVRYLDGHAPPGTLGTPNVEAGFARMCTLLASWATPNTNDALTALQATPNYTVDDLWDLPDEPTVLTLTALAERLRTHDTDRPLETWRAWGHDYAEPTGPATLKRADTGQAGTGLPAGVWGASTPTLVPHWATADLLIGTHLIDVHAADPTTNPTAIAHWLWRLAAYTWLDTANHYRARTVGLYLAAHGLHITWDATTFTQALLASPKGTEAARKDFLTQARKIIKTEGATPPPTPGLKVPIPWRPRP